MKALLSAEERKRRKKVHEHAANARRSAMIDRSVPECGREKIARTDLGLALLQRRAIPGVPLSRDDLAAWCGCTTAAIYLLERRALKKLRNRLLFGDRATAAELLLELCDRREPARRAA